MASTRDAFSFMENLGSVWSGAREKLDYVSCICVLTETWHLGSSSPTPKRASGLLSTSQNWHENSFPGQCSFLFPLWVSAHYYYFICLESFVTCIQALLSITKCVSYHLSRTQLPCSRGSFQNAWPHMLLGTEVRQLRFDNVHHHCSTSNSNNNLILFGWHWVLSQCLCQRQTLTDTDVTAEDAECPPKSQKCLQSEPG